MMAGDGDRGSDGRADDAADRLAFLGGVRRRVRADRSGPALWALVVVALAVLGSAVVYARFPEVAAQVVPGSGGGYRVPREDTLANFGGSPPHRAGGVYWLVATPIVWGVCGWLFRRRHGLGLGRPWWQLPAVGMVPFAALVMGQFVLAPRLEPVHHLLTDPDRKVLPVVAIGLGLLLVGALEHAPALVGTGAVVAVLPLVPLGPGMLVDLVDPRLHLGQVTWLVVELGGAALAVAAVVVVRARLHRRPPARATG